MGYGLPGCLEGAANNNSLTVYFGKLLWRSFTTLSPKFPVMFQKQVLHSKWHHCVPRWSGKSQRWLTMVSNIRELGAMRDRNRGVEELGQISHDNFQWQSKHEGPSGRLRFLMKWPLLCYRFWKLLPFTFIVGEKKLCYSIKVTNIYEVKSENTLQFDQHLWRGKQNQ